MKKPTNAKLAAAPVAEQLAELARAHTQDAVNTLVILLREAEDPRLQLAAAKILLERGWGRAPAAKWHDETAGSATDKTISSTAAKLAREMLEQIASGKNGSLAGAAELATDRKA